LLLLDSVGIHLRSERGFSLIELLLVVALIGVLSAVAIGITPGIIQSVKGSGGATQVGSFLKRTREVAISRRRNIEIRFLAPNTVESWQRGVPNPPAATPVPALLERMVFEGRVEYRRFVLVPNDTPDAFAAGAAAINLGGANPVMFTSEGSFADVNGDPINATVFLGIDQKPLSSNALTILGTTAAIRSWRWNGRAWVE
jgi:prepilin-type N-terminal cleavage/methylation domain-containing protein